ncbi:MAG: acyl-CoA thioesterase-1 [Kiritimatiellia bacterium]|jgi:acyl-CoA thioesterase-1
MITAPHKVTLLADSLAMPRPPGEGDLRLEETYPYLLDLLCRQRLGTAAPLFVERGKRFRTIDQVVDDWPEEVIIKQADIALVQVGIADCAPRVFSRRQHAMLARWPKPLRESVIHFVHKHRRALIRLRPQCVYVKEKNFHECVFKLATWAKRENAAQLIFVNIIRPTDEMEHRSPGYQAKVDAYNACLAQYVDHEHIHLQDLCAQVAAGGSDHLTIDGIHLNREGHRGLAIALSEQICKLLTPTPAKAYA